MSAAVLVVYINGVLTLICCYFVRQRLYLLFKLVSCIITVYGIVTTTAVMVLSYFVLCNLKVDLKGKECSEECIGDLGPHRAVYCTL